MATNFGSIRTMLTAGTIGASTFMFPANSTAFLPPVATSMPARAEGLGAHYVEGFGSIARDERVRALFEKFASEWVRDTGNLSDATSVLIHPSYHRILALGTSALPFIFDDMADGNGARWLSALDAITLGRANPIPPDHEEDALVMCQDWLEWWNGNERVA